MNPFLLSFFLYCVISSRAKESFLTSGDLYVPLGEHVKLECEIRKRIEIQGFKILETKWTYLGVGHEENLGHSVYERIWRNDSDFSLMLYEVQEYDAGKYECFVLSQNGKFNVTNSSSVNIGKWFGCFAIYKSLSPSLRRYFSRPELRLEGRTKTIIEPYGPLYVWNL